MSDSPAIIRLEHHYSQPPAAVWRVLTTPELFARWWAAGDIQPRVGHRFELDMGRWGMQRCEVLAVEPERLLSIRFAEGQLDTTISWQLFAEGTGTRLQFTHEGFDLDSPLGKSAFEGMAPGWPGLLARIAKVAEL
jgi:uncharacterized protein YndB with AHSA1/START domain